jgi:hypothetical protein
MPVLALNDLPAIIYVSRDFIKPGNEAAYRPIEQDGRAICIKLRCPHPYLGLESLSVPHEALFLNLLVSDAELHAVGAGYDANPKLLAALDTIKQRKAGLVGTAQEFVAHVRPDLSVAATWHMGCARFFVIAFTGPDMKIAGSVFDSDNGLRMTVRQECARDRADAAAHVMGPAARLFAVRQYWSMPDPTWRAADPAFWNAAVPDR